MEEYLSSKYDSLAFQKFINNLRNATAEYFMEI